MPTSNLDENAVEELFEAMTGLSRSLRSAAHRWPVETHGVRRTDVVLLRMIANEGECRAGGIASRLGLAASVISRQMAALERDGMIERRPDPEDGRAGLVRLTDLGAARLAEVRRSYVSLLSARLEGWDRDKAARATALLGELTDLMVTHPASAATEPATGTDADSDASTPAASSATTGTRDAE